MIIFLEIWPACDLISLSNDSIIRSTYKSGLECIAHITRNVLTKYGVLMIIFTEITNKYVSLACIWVTVFVLLITLLSMDTKGRKLRLILHLKIFITFLILVLEKRSWYHFNPYLKPFPWKLFIFITNNSFFLVTYLHNMSYVPLVWLVFKNQHYHDDQPAIIALFYPLFFNTRICPWKHIDFLSYSLATLVENE